VGGVVRSTGSGMGCPDWPRCFGSWVPPTRVEQLPADYKTTYAALREKKNQKFVSYLRAAGFSETAAQLERDPSVRVEEDFNATKTWIEYLNRLVGVAIGLFIIILVWRGWQVRRHKSWLFYGAIALLLLTMVQGWFGSIVVSTNLTTWTVTVHMFLAVLIVGFLIHLWHASGSQTPIQTGPAVRWVVVVCMILMAVQIFLGTAVREMVDVVSREADRSFWIERIGRPFIVHRGFSWLVLGAHLALLAMLWRAKNALARAVFVVTLASILTGAGMAYFEVPPALQPLHLLLATVLIGLQYVLYLRLNIQGKEVFTN
jgi:cytochrome c oxidase assembly protein subunit 15